MRRAVLRPSSCLHGPHRVSPRRRAVALGLALLLLLTAAAGPALARGHQKKENPRWAVVLAVFGSTREGGMAGVERVRERVARAVPGVPVALGLTGRHAVGGQSGEAKAGGDQVREGVLTAMARLSDQGYRHIFLQPLHVSAGSEYADLAALAKALNALAASGARKTPFARVVLGVPALGATRTPSPADLQGIVSALAADADQARANDAALLFGAHGNPAWPATELSAFQAAMRRAYPGQAVFAAAMESSPGIGEAMRGLARSGKKKVLLLPLLFGAGAHAAEDLCGPDKDSWKSRLEAAGYLVDCRMRGLGELEAYADMIAARVSKALEKGK